MCFFLPRRRRSADGASLGCTTNFALDVYFALQFYYLKLLLAPQNRMFEFSVSFCPRFAKGFFAKGCTTQAVFNCCSKQKSKHNL